MALGIGSVQADDTLLCAQAIRRVEPDSALPAGLLAAVAMNESGRYDAARRAGSPWPWTVTSGSDGRYFASKDAAIRHVEKLRGSGRRNIDVGCMQINLMHHPDAFAGLKDALDPERNVTYGAGFLRRLWAETRSWEHAIARYHSGEPMRGRLYRERVYGHWQNLVRGRKIAASMARSLRVPHDRAVAAHVPGSGIVSFRPAIGRVVVLRPAAAIGSGVLRLARRYPAAPGPSTLREDQH